MASHTFTVESPLSCTDAFARLVDLERVTEWDEGIIDSTRLGPAGEVLGARFDVTVTGFDGRPTTVVYEITEADAPRRFVMTGEHDTFRAIDELTFAERSDGCSLTYVAGLELIGDDPPMTAAQLDSLFPKIAAVAEVGLMRFLDPPVAPESAVG